ncbi:hypothetical protein C0Q70_07192 [Pomacea canaliculata]|uniref:Uncharacterized protein n=2 Tax=Pomacea canaliculata TaxID=400727 RepID=A0A2T7PED3_POMCA|nr:hypothetical protein C0Q70_07192 [Pomacea canaliculata]
MGQKRDLAPRRCISLGEDPEQILGPRTTNLFSLHVTTPCPIAIHIDECGDDYDDKDDEEEDTNLHQRTLKRTRPILAEPKPLTSHFCNGSPNFSPSSTRRSTSRFLEPPECSDLALLKATALRLKLKTRRSSFLEWQARSFLAPPTLVPAGDVTEKLTSERKERINGALEWLKSELTEMRSMDQHLARQLLSLRHDIHQLRLSRSCQLHRALLDDVQSDIEEQVAFSDVLDLPSVTLNSTPLKLLGVTRMNLSARRFSTC